MNCIYFVCADCQSSIDAGYRWAYWRLEHPGVVRRGKTVSVSSVLGTAKYWNPPPEEQSMWLVRDVLPSVRRFLEEHHDHAVLFLEEDDLFEKGYTEVSNKRDDLADPEYEKGGSSR